MHLRVCNFILNLRVCTVSTVMVASQISASASVNLQAKLSGFDLGRSRRKWLPSSSRFSLSNSQQNLYSQANHGVAAIIFGDGSESRLYPLTKRRSEGAIPMAANYRLIDAVVSNCINSNINKIYAITQFNSTSLNSHLSRAYNGVGLGKDGFVEVIAAYQSSEDEGWFQGTADAIRRCLWVLEEHPVSEFLVLPGHHLYKMDYQRLIEAHRSSQADITLAALNSPKNQDAGFGLLNVNAYNEVVEFNLKSKKELVNVGSVQNNGKCKEVAFCQVPSMGIYLVNRHTMTKLLEEYFPDANDFGTQVIPGAISSGMKIKAHLCGGYWEDMRNIRAFYHANMECIKGSSNTGFNFYDRDLPIYTMPRYVPPTIVGDAVITDSVIGDGCILNGCKINRTVVGMRTRIGDRAIVEDSVIMGADIYQNDNIQHSGMDGNGVEIPIGIGDDSQIRKAIIDKNARIGRNVMIMNKDKVEEANREDNGYIISGGIVVVLRGAVIPHGTIF